MATQNIRTILGYNVISVIVFKNENGRVLANKIPGCKPHSYTVEFVKGGNTTVKRKQYAIDSIKSQNL